MKKVIIFGDSITHGVDDVERGGWASRLKTHLWNTWEETGEINIYDLGVDGDTISGVLERFDSEVASRVPDGIVFAIGLNDTVTFKDGSELISVEQFERNYLTLIEKVKRIGAKVLCIGLTPVIEDRLQPYAMGRNQPYYHLKRVIDFEVTIMKLCERLNIPFVRVLDAVSVVTLEYDGLHPDAKGHQAIFEQIRDPLISAFR